MPEDVQSHADGDVLEARRWRLISRLHNAVTSGSELQLLCAAVAELMSEEIGDVAVAVVRDPDNPSTTIRALNHSDPVARAGLVSLFEGVNDDTLNRWLGALSNAGARAHRTLLRNAPDNDWAAALLSWGEANVSDTAHVSLRYQDGSVRGMLICARSRGSAPFDEFDISALVGAADTVSLALAVADLAEQRRRLLSELISAEQAERQRIAHDVHDDTMQVLAAAQLRLEIHHNHLRQVEDETLLAQSDEVADLVSSAQRALRHLLLDLDSPSSPGLQIHDVLTDSASSFFDGGETDVAVTCSLTEIPEDIATVFVRAGREALSNARQHAGASNVTLDLTQDDDFWRMTVSDDGIGIPDEIPIQPGHLGVRGMATRVAALSGTFSMQQRPEGGTIVRLEIPRRRPAT